MTFHKIIVALDDSPLSQVVFSEALDIATAQSASLMLFHCISEEAIAQPVIALPIELGMTSEVVTETYQVQQLRLDTLNQRARAMLDQFCTKAAERGVLAEYDCKIGSPGHRLCELAQSWNASLILIGRRGRTGLAEAFMGSVSNYVVHNAPCSVLVIQ
ncbi:universal stress protein [Ancylothrix sp. C2]|uniref:universal stress protein n=1 Tax=Ancylothrix sp. D3o TaxID=2953691 RepID=UPI0021BB677F|nr:universal stress protein [Ancylothrix sp. D3o]MCT7949632.1 universal stress protein [Ancylothrix sp. D3o]